MRSWTELNRTEYDKVWDKFYSDFHFRPSIYRWNWPSFTVPSPFITFSISTYFDLPETTMDELYSDLERKTVDALITCTPQGSLIYALDWQHPCYWVDPRTGFTDPVPEGVFRIPFIPNGDYYLFLETDFRWGYLGHPWEKTITIFGDELVQAFRRKTPLLFDHVLRQGEPPRKSV